MDTKYQDVMSPLETRRNAAMRRRLNIDPAFPEGIEFSVASTPMDIEAACALLYEAYTDSGFMVADGSGYRFTVHHALPYCYTLIAKEAGKVIATATLIVKSVDKLPIEKIFPITPYLRFGRRVVEISGLTVHSEARSSRGPLLFPLFKYAYKLATRQLGATDLVVTTNPNHLSFYRAIILFEKMSDKVCYDYIDGIPTLGARLDLATLPERYEDVYGRQPLNKNIYEYCIKSEFPQFGIPDQVDKVYSGNKWTPDQLAWMLENLAIGLSELSGDDMARLRTAYGPEYDSVFARFAPQLAPRGDTERIDLNIDASITNGGSGLEARILAIAGNELHLSVEVPPKPQLSGAQLTFSSDLCSRSLPVNYHRSIGNDEHIFHIDPAPFYAALLGDKSIQPRATP
jgi:hypothetical protein